MTLEEFFDVFKEVHEKDSPFRLRSSLGGISVAIRQLGGKKACPISAVCNYKHKTSYDSTQFRNAARVLNIEDNLARKIMHAADGEPSYIRTRMLEIILEN